MKNVFRGEIAAPDHLRCRRSDGRGWQCPRPALGPVKFCDHHYRLQKKNVAKIAAKLNIKNRKAKATSKIKNPKKRPQTREPPSDRQPKKRMREAEPTAVPSPQMVELIGLALRRQMERREKRERIKRDAAHQFVRRNLPNGVMEISSRGLSNAGQVVDRKIGFNAGQLFQRRYRSKNAEPLPVASHQELPYRRGSPMAGKRVCHRCSKSKLTHMVRCSGCWKFFCTSCINKWYSKISELEFMASCPICQGSCTCKRCRQYEDGVSKDSENNKKNSGKIRHVQYLICQFLPVLKQKQITQLELEATNQGRKLSSIQLQVAKYRSGELLKCNYCEVSIADFHRSCSICSFKVCLRCCQDLRGSLNQGVTIVTYRYPTRGRPRKQVSKEINRMNRRLGTSPVLPLGKANNGDNAISCPSKENGGCGVGILNLIFILPLGVSKKLEING